MSRIISIGTAVPKYGLSQNSILDYLHTAYNDDTTSRKLKVLFHKSGISTRYSAVSDFDGNMSGSNLFTGNEVLPNVENRLNVFKENASSLAISAIHSSLGKVNLTIPEFLPTHLITVTCTGLYAPGLDTEIIEQLNLPNDIFHTSINFMGCNAAFPALKIADMIAKTQENARVIVVCVELCTLHFQPKNNTDNLLSNSIFGDGAAAVIVVSDNFANQIHFNGLEMNGFYSILLSKGKNYMGWNINPVNFEMVLDSLVPEFIGDEVIDILSKAGKYLNIS
jgi:predicted naringenin-chalcone synthase